MIYKIFFKSALREIFSSTMSRLNRRINARANSTTSEHIMIGIGISIAASAVYTPCDSLMDGLYKQPSVPPVALYEPYNTFVKVC